MEYTPSDISSGSINDGYCSEHQWEYRQRSIQMQMTQIKTFTYHLEMRPGTAITGSGSVTC